MTAATMDLAALFDMPSWDAESYEALKESAFADTDAFNRFRTLRRELEDKVQAASKPSHEDCLKLGLASAMLADPDAQDQLDAALKWLEKASPSALRHYCLGRLHRQRKAFTASIAAFEQASAAGWDAMICGLECAETHIVAGAPEKAEAIVAKYTASAETSAHYNYLRGRLHEVAGDHVAAIESYEHAQDLSDRFPEAAFRLAFLLDLHGDDEQAKHYYEECIWMPNVHVASLINLAVLYEDDLEFERAASCLRRVLAIYPNHPRAQLYFKDVLASKNMYFDEVQAQVQIQQHAVLDTPISDFELSVRSRNCLKKMNIHSLGDLLKITERELLAYKNFGETSLNEIRAMLSQKGLKLGQFATDAGAASPERPAPPALQGAPELLGRPLSTLELSVRSRKCLQRLGLQTVSDLIQTSEAELLAAKNFGQTSLSEIKKRLTELGLSLRTSS